MKASQTSMVALARPVGRIVVPPGESAPLSPDDCPPLSSKHLTTLDGLRGIAILVVMVRHFVPEPDTAKGGLHYLLKILYTGWVGVDLFFVLSGFLITGILWDAKGASHFFRNFYMRRILRIFPLYYAVLAALFIVLPGLAWLGFSTGWPLGPALSAVLTPFQVLAHWQPWFWLYASNLKACLTRPDLPSYGLGHFWSLAVEEQFYLRWPFVVFACTREVLLRVYLWGAGGALLIRSAFVLGGGGWQIPYMSPFCRMDALLMGAFIALLARVDGETGAGRLMARWFLPGLVPVVAVLLLFTYRDTAAMMSGGYTLLAVFFATVVHGAARPGTLWHAVFANPVLRLFGKYSYGLYVFHFLLCSGFDVFFAAPESGRRGTLAGGRHLSPCGAVDCHLPGRRPDRLAPFRKAFPPAQTLFSLSRMNTVKSIRAAHCPCLAEVFFSIHA